MIAYFRSTVQTGTVFNRRAWNNLCDFRHGLTVVVHTQYFRVKYTQIRNDKIPRKDSSSNIFDYDLDSGFIFTGVTEFIPV